MSEVVVVSIISLCGTLLGTFGGIIASTKLMTYRIEQLEKKVEKHNTLVERMYKVEEDIAIINTKVKQ